MTGAAQPLLHRVGPAGTFAADSAFGVALVGLWHRVASTGEGGLGFAPPVQRSEIGKPAAALVEAIRRGETHAVALTAGRALVGFAQLRPGVGVFAHTGQLASVMVDPDHQRRGLGTRLTDAALDIARELRLEAVGLSMRDGTGLQSFYTTFGFTEVGRRPGWVRVAPGDDRDEVLMTTRVGPPV